MMKLLNPLLRRPTSRITGGSGGYILLTVLVAAMILSSLGAIAAQVLMNNSRFTQFQVRQASALQVAEAGVNYYLWHLAHNPTDYQDGNTGGTAPFGPYTHNYYSADGDLLGTYTLTVTPPANGSTITTVKSVGQVPHLTGGRTILAQLGQPSFSNYIFLSNSELDFSSSATTTGPVFSNVGINFEGTNNGPVTAARSTYVSLVDGRTHNGVWGGGGPQSQWQYPVPSINFTSVTTNLSSLQTQAASGGLSLTSGSGGIGYYLSLRSDGTIDVYKVTNENSSGITKSASPIFNKPAPANGILFSNEELWISGTSWPKRITIVAAKLPDNSATRKSINIIGNLTYAAQDGSDVIGLVAQQDIFLPQYVPSTLEVDAALLAQYGSVGYDTNNGGVKTVFTLFGSLAQNQNSYGFKVVGCGSYCSGFPTTNYNFDSHLIYAPPPGFPTTGNYSILNWREQLFSP